MLDTFFHGTMTFSLIPQFIFMCGSLITKNRIIIREIPFAEMALSIKLEISAHVLENVAWAAEKT